MSSFQDLANPGEVGVRVLASRIAVDGLCDAVLDYREAVADNSPGSRSAPWETDAILRYRVAVESFAKTDSTATR